MIKAVAFDFDHTLYDRSLTNDNMVDDYRRFFADYLKPGISREEVLAAIKQADSGSFRRKRGPTPTTKSKDAGQHWMGIYTATLDTGIFAREPGYDLYYYGFIEKAFPKTMVLYPDTLPTLQWLKEQGYVTGILTNGPSDFQRAKLEALNMYEAVDAVVLCGDLEEQKPHTMAFEAICAAMGCKTTEAVYVGDNPRNDVDGARKAGMTPIWMRSVGVWRDEIEPARYCIDAIGEIPELLKIMEREASL